MPPSQSDREDVRRDWTVPVIEPGLQPRVPPTDILATPYTTNVLRDVADERKRQDERWGPVSRPPLEWFAIAGEEYGEVAEHVVKGWVPPESDFDREGYRTELIQLAAVCVSAVENLDYGTAGLGRTYPEKARDAE